MFPAALLEMLSHAKDKTGENPWPLELPFKVMPSSIDRVVSISSIKGLGNQVMRAVH